VFLLNNNLRENKKHAKRVVAIFCIGILGLLILVYAPNIHFSIPCVFKWVTGIPCPGCGLTRAIAMALRFNFIEAALTNILFLPLLAGAVTYFICALIEIIFNKPTIDYINSVLVKKWVIVIAAALTAISWYYNIVRGI
jgi:hypothetical protein